MVWSYLSSLAYHASKGEQDAYAAVEFEEGLPLQVEGMGILKQDRVNPCLSKWIEFMMRPASLARMAEKQWMVPAFKGVALPPHFDQLPQVKKAAKLELSVGALDQLLSHFGRDLQGDGI